MKDLRYLILFLPLLLVSCGTSKKAVTSTPAPAAEKVVKKVTAEQIVAKIESKQVTDEFLTSKMNFRFKSGSQDLSVGGNLKMKKNDVIQLSLVAFGLMEAARVEFTPEDVLVIDRIHKGYIQASYSEFDFLKNAGIDFSVLEAFFRDAIFVPSNQTGLKLDYATNGDVVVSCQNKELKFRFQAEQDSMLVKNTQITSAKGGKAAFNWVYSNFTKFNDKLFPLMHQITIKGVGHDAEVDVQLKNLGSDSKWETRTKVKSSYKKMQPADLLKMLQF